MNQTQTQEKVLLSGLSDYELPFQVTKTVNKSLKLSSERQIKKMSLIDDVSKRNREKFLKKLLKTIPVRKAENKPYMQLSGFEFSFLKNKEKEYISKGRFNVFDISTDPYLLKFYQIIRAKHLGNYEDVPTEIIECCLNYIAYVLVGDLIRRKNLSPETTTIIIPLRGALAFLDAWIAFGFTKFVYIDISRMGEGHKLKAVINYISSLKINFDDVVISDPLFATGTTMMALLKLLFKKGCDQNRTHLLSMLTAPDGVGLILSKFDGIEISTGVNDEGVTDDAYVYPGVGDLGKILRPTITPKRIGSWVGIGAMTMADADHTAKILDRD